MIATSSFVVLEHLYSIEFYEKHVPTVGFASYFQAVGRVSILTIGQQTIMDAYLCALHLVAGIAAGNSE